MPRKNIAVMPAPSQPTKENKKHHLVSFYE
jgi:hypothetical protein